MISFDAPGYLLFLSLLPVGIYVHHFFSRRGGRVLFSFAKWKGDSFHYPARMLRLVLFLGSVSFWVGAGALVVAMAGPIRIERDTVYLSRGLDIMIVIDESPSMSAQDFQPGNRFGAAKQVVRRFVAGRKNDAIGLVSFGREAALRVPPTLDSGTLLERLDALRIMSLGDGTAIGMGLSVAALHLERSGSTQRVIVLMTDGENNAGEIQPDTAAELAYRLGIRVYAIGIGTQGEVPIEYTDPDTGVVRKGLFDSKFDEELLTTIAEKTGGRYYSARSPGALNAVFRSIDALETTEKRARIEVHTTALYLQVVAFALACLLFSFFVRVVVLREALA